MIELIIVIVVAGILAAVMIPKMERDSLREAANQLVRHIQYTQHLAMVDDVYDTTAVRKNGTPGWERGLWSINFRKNNCYAVQSDRDYSGGSKREESAVDPATNTYLYSNTKCTKDKNDNSDLLLKDKYDVTIALSKGCKKKTEMYISFDNLGRPLKNRRVANPITESSACTITLESSSKRKAVITVEPETGYTHITSFDSF